MEQAQATNGEQSTSAMNSQNIGIDPEIIASNEQTTTDPEAGLDPQRERTDVEQLKATVEQLKAVIEKMTTSQEQANSKVDELTTVLKEEMINTENKTKIAIDEAMSKSRQLAPRNLVVCIDGTSNQFGPKVRHVKLFGKTSSEVIS